MDNWSRFFVRWKLILGVFLPILFIGLMMLIENPLLAIGILLFVGLALGVAYMFARYANIET